MLALIFGVLFAVSFLGFAITSRTKYSAASHLFWGVAFIIFTVCFTCAFCDGKTLYIHRANFQIIDTALLD